MPPGRIEGVVRAPAGDGRAVRVAGAVLVLVRGPEVGLRVELRERVDIALPSVYSDTNVSTTNGDISEGADEIIRALEL